MSYLKRCAIAPALMLGLFAATDAHGCTTSGTNIDLGHHTSYAAAANPATGSGSSGLSCDILLAALTAHYVGMRVDASSFVLTGPGGQTIAYTAALTPNGAPLTTGNFQNLSSLSLVSLFAGTNSSIPLYIRTSASPALRAGTYSGSLDIRWYYSVCALGVAVCLAHSASPGFVRPVPLVTPINWGTGTAVRVDISLTIDKDCVIDAPKLDFGSAPLVGAFNPVTRTIRIRCSAGAAYTVGLDDGGRASGATRRMASGTHFLAYEIYKSASSADRWGNVGTTRRSSASADANAGIYDSITAQSFTYRAAILPGQVTPPAGTYSDTVRIDVEF
jgi:spore coat protein U-like protein